jgi:hypothetical protein
VLLIVGAAATAGLLAVRLDERVPMLVAKQTIPVGQKIERSDLAVARVASSDVQLIPADNAGSVVGKYARQHIPGGRLLDKAMFGGSPLLGAGEVALGVVLKPGNVPASGLQAGDRVKVYRAKDGVGTLLAPDAKVSFVENEDSDGNAFGGGNSGGGDIEATIIVVDDDEGKLSAAIGAASFAGQVVLGLSERGGDADN